MNTVDEQQFPDDRIFLEEYTQALLNALRSIPTEEFLHITGKLSETIKSRNTIYVCGNGGSASIADHLATDFSKGVSAGTNLLPKVWSLVSNTALLTALANDIAYDRVYSEQIKLFAGPKDVLLIVSSSGNSENVIQAITAAKKLNLTTIGVVGFDGGQALELCDHAIHFNSTNYGIVEDASQAVMHMFAQHIRMRHLPKSESSNTIF